jgi:hypothetical protein
MKTLTFLAMTILSGAIAGTILGIINQGVAEPFLDKAIELETEKKMNAGEEVLNPIELEQYRLWQKGGMIAAGAILGISVGGLFGIVFAYSRGSLPGADNKKKALILAGIMWFVLFLVPAVKYPGNPPGVGDPETIYYRVPLYVSFVAVSGFSTIGLAYLYRKLGNREFKKLAIPSAYAIIMIASYFAWPPNPDPITAPMDLVTNFRIATAFTMSIFWGLIGIILGAFWDKLRPHETSKIATV